MQWCIQMSGSRETKKYTTLLRSADNEIMSKLMDEEVISEKAKTVKTKLNGR